MNRILRASTVLVVALTAGAAALAQGAAPAGDATRGKQLYMTIGCSSLIQECFGRNQSGKPLHTGEMDASSPIHPVNVPPRFASWPP